jgi:hypothetical protein
VLGDSKSVSDGEDKILIAIGVLTGKVDAMHRRQDRMDKRLGHIEEAANFGRGAVKATLKIGSIIAVLVGAGAWMWDKLG